MRVVFIRHGLTAGNLEKRYIGSTDEPLCSAGIAELKKLTYPACEVLICSPMKRCIQTAELLYPAQDIEVCDELRECDFGSFEGKNYKELSGDPDYQRWIDSGGEMPFPNGESPADFRQRCAAAFKMIVRKYAHSGSIAFVVHGGTIMAVLEKYAVPHGDYFSWHCENGHGYVCGFDGTELKITEKI